MTQPLVAGRIAPGRFRKLYGLLGDLDLGASRAAGEDLYGPAAAVAGREVHPGIDPGGIPAQDLLHGAQLLEGLPPVQKGKLAQAGEGVAAGKLLPGLPVLLAQIEVVHGDLERAFQPALDRGQGGSLVVKEAHQLGAEIGGRRRFRLGEFRQDGEELVGIAAVGGDQAVGPELGQLAFAQVGQGRDGKALDAFDECYAQHLGNRPELSDGKHAHGLVRLDEVLDILPVQAQFGMGDEILGQTVDARQPPMGIGGEGGKLPVKAPGEVQQDIAGVSLQDVLVIEYPVGGRRGFLLQAAGSGEIGADPADPLTGLPETLEQFGRRLGSGVHLLLPGMTLGMFPDLRRGEFHRRSPRFRPPLVPGVHHEERRRDVAAFPQQSHRTLQRVDRRLEDQGGFPGHEPAGMVAQDPRLDAEPGAAQPCQRSQGADCGRCQGERQVGRNAPGRKRLLPVQEQSGKRADSRARDGRQGDPEEAAPGERIFDPDLSIRPPVHQGGAAQPQLPQHSEGFASFILFCEVTYENADVHYLSFY